MNNTPITPLLLQQEEDDATPPTSASAAFPVHKKLTLSDIPHVTKLYELGIISKAKLQQIVSQVYPDAGPVRARKRKLYTTPSPESTSTPPRNKSTSTPPPNKSTSTPPRKKSTSKSPRKKSTSKPPRKKRAGRSSPSTFALRKLAKDATRRRFFEQCLKLDSILWCTTLGKRKAEMDDLLFLRAAKDPVDELYASHPGALRSVTKVKLESVVKWQVCLFYITII